MVAEMEILQQMSHPHIMAVYSLLHDQSNFYIETEICAGGELFDRLAE